MFQVDRAVQACSHLIALFVFQVDGAVQACSHSGALFVFQVDGAVQACSHSVALFVFQVDGAIQARDVAPGVARLGRAVQTHQAELPGHEERRPQPHHEVHLP